jgi:hypothetical protein
MVSYNNIQKCRGNSSSQIVGVAAHNASVNEVCVYLSQVNSPNLLVKNMNAAPIPNGSLLKPDPNNPGCVLAINSLIANDGPVIGRLEIGNNLINDQIDGYPGSGPAKTGQAQIMI